MQTIPCFRFGDLGITASIKFIYVALVPVLHFSQELGAEVVVIERIGTGDCGIEINTAKLPNASQVFKNSSLVELSNGSGMPVGLSSLSSASATSLLSRSVVAHNYNLVIHSNASMQSSHQLRAPHHF